MTIITLNNQMVEVDVESDTPLLWVLRDHLGMTGTKFGCGMALCGACTVHVDGDAVRSCVLPLGASRARPSPPSRGSSTDRSHAVQQAWIELDVPQCGYCQSGQIMSAAALLQDESATERRGYRRGHGRQHLPLRHLPADPQGDPSRRRAVAPDDGVSGSSTDPAANFARRPPAAAAASCSRRRLRGAFMRAARESIAAPRRSGPRS